MQKFLFGFIIGTLLILGALVIYSKITQANQLIAVETQTLRLLADTSKKNNATTLNELNIKVLSLDEKTNSINKRFDDFYVMGGIVVVLLLAINIGVFVNVEWKIEKYFKSNFEDHLKRINDYEKKAAEQLGKIQTYVKYIEQRFDIKNIEQTVIQNDTQQNDTPS